MESFGSTHHHNGAVIKATQVGIHAMKIRLQKNPKDLLQHGRNLRTGMRMSTVHLVMHTALMRQPRQRSAGIVQMIIMVNFGMVRIGVNLKTVEIRKSLTKSIVQMFITETMQQFNRRVMDLWAITVTTMTLMTLFGLQRIAQ